MRDALRQDVDGLLVVDKPSGLTSHDVVVRIRRVFDGKVGHTGTLDPGATGVLPILLGAATRLSRFLQLDEKEYEFTLKLGVWTDTYDADGKITGSAPVPELSEREVEEVLDRFRGAIEQKPPPYSALKVRGERLYKKARRNEIVDVPLRPVTIHRLEALQLEREVWRLRMSCSSGTYVRSLAFDIGRKIGCGAHVSQLRRLRVGRFSLDSAVALDDLEGSWRDALIPLERLLPQFPEVRLNPEQRTRIAHGNYIEAPEGVGRPGEFCRLICGTRLIAVGTVEEGVIRPNIVLAKA